MVTRLSAAIAAIAVATLANRDGVVAGFIPPPPSSSAFAYTAPSSSCRPSTPSIVRQRRSSSPSSSSRTILVTMAGRGFGDKPTTTTTKTTGTRKKSSPPPSSSSVETGKGEEGGGGDLISTSTGEGEDGEGEGEDDVASGSTLLRTLRSRDAERRDDELRKIRALREADALLAEDAGAAVIPERVARRMGRRMLPFVGIPLFGSVGSFVGFWYMATYGDMEFQPAIVATTSFVFLAIGLLVRALLWVGGDGGGMGGGWERWDIAISFHSIIR
ncbi:hypothetical protein ACHAXA_011012 [Cyclostephanos tholiformis]|uniref:Uncharacterized protein n=1 Tax=Cyclostephanos tholiformis TaxID=382380 RepID=A0ABD3R2Y0_9STRA